MEVRDGAWWVGSRRCFLIRHLLLFVSSARTAAGLLRPCGRRERDRVTPPRPHGQSVRLSPLAQRFPCCAICKRPLCREAQSSRLPSGGKARGAGTACAARPGGWLAELPSMAPTQRGEPRHAWCLFLRGWPTFTPKRRSRLSGRRTRGRDLQRPRNPPFPELRTANKKCFFCSVLLVVQSHKNTVDTFLCPNVQSYSPWADWSPPPPHARKTRTGKAAREGIHRQSGRTGHVGKTCKLFQ